MSLNAESLTHSKLQNNHIKKEVRSILGYIDDELLKVNISGKFEITLSLPINFSIPYMNNADAQRKIYYNVLVSLIDRNFIPKLELHQNATLIHIRWKTDREIAEMQMQNALIAKYSS